MAKTLPPLKVQFQKDGQPDGVKEIDDPRTQYCEEYNRAGEQFGRTAKPILAASPVGLVELSSPKPMFAVVDGSGKARHVAEADDAAAFASRYNAMMANKGNPSRLRLVELALFAKASADAE